MNLNPGRLLTDARKLTAALTGALAVGISNGLISGTAERWTTSGLAVATAFLVALVPNTTTPLDSPPTGP